TTSAPSGASTPESTAVMVPPSTITSGSGIRAELVPSNSHGARSAVSRPRSVRIAVVFIPSASLMTCTDVVGGTTHFRYLPDLGLAMWSVLEPGRSANHTAHVYDVDYIIACDAGRG